MRKPAAAFMSPEVSPVLPNYSGRIRLAASPGLRCLHLDSHRHRIAKVILQLMVFICANLVRFPLQDLQCNLRDSCLGAASSRLVEVLHWAGDWCGSGPSNL